MFGLGSSSQLGIGIAIRLHDQFSQQAQRINQQLLAMRRNSQSALLSGIRDYKNQSLAIAGGAAAMSYGMMQMAKQGAAFQHQINAIAIIGEGKLGKSREEIAKFATTMSEQFTYSSAEVADVMLENIRAGVGKGVDEITRFQAMVATATGEALAGEQGVGAKLLGISNAMNLNPMGEYMDGMTQFERISHAVTGAANATAASVYSIGESMEYFSNSAAIAGLNLEETLALVGKLSQSQIKGTAAGTALNNMIMQMIKNSGQNAGPKKMNAWAAIGVNPEDIRALVNSGEKGAVMKALKIIDNAARTLPTSDRLENLNEIFNMRGGRGIVNAFFGGTKSLEQILAETNAAVTNRMATTKSGQMMNDLHSDIIKAGNAWKNFINSFVEEMAPTIRVVMRGFMGAMKLASNFLHTGLGSVLGKIVVIGTPFIAVLFGLRAAALMATLALRGFSISNGVGGFGGLLRGGLGSIGMAGVGPYGGQMRRNAAGRWMVNAGQTISHGGKDYKGGQLLPSAFLASQGLGARAGAAASTGSRVLGWLGRIGGFLGRLLPIVGWIGMIWSAVSIIKNLFFDSKRDEVANLDPIFRQYYRDLDTKYFGRDNAERWYGREGLTNPDGSPMVMTQNISLNIDGVQANREAIKNYVMAGQQQQINNQMNFELPEEW